MYQVNTSITKIRKEIKHIFITLWLAGISYGEISKLLEKKIAPLFRERNIRYHVGVYKKKLNKRGRDD